MSDTSDYFTQPYLTPANVATILAVSEDTVMRHFATMDGVIDVGTPGSMHKRRKRVLRIPQRTLEMYLAERRVKARR